MSGLPGLRDIHLLSRERTAMMFSFKSLFRTSASASSANSLNSNGPSATLSSVDLDQVPFPTNPAVVKRSRHNSCPKHLPNPEACVDDVRYFLFILLTSKLNNCAKHYPEWVIETCLAWKGGGLQFLNCTEEQLEDLCPMTAAIGFDDHKHKIGTHIPFPIRQEIGETIARFVLKKKEGEIRQRLQEERNRPFLPRERQSIALSAHGLGDPIMTTSLSQPLSGSRSVYLPRAQHSRRSSSSLSTRSVRRHINTLPRMLSSVSLSESPIIISESDNCPPTIASAVNSSGSKDFAPTHLTIKTAKVSTGIKASNVLGSTFQPFSSTPIAASMSRPLSPSNIRAVRSDRKQNAPQSASNILSIEQPAPFINREPGVNLFSRYTMPPGYLAVDTGVKARNSVLPLPVQRPTMAQNQSSCTEEGKDKDMRHDSGIENSSQASIHSTYPIPRHASPSVIVNSLQDGINFNTLNYNRSNNVRLLTNGILRTSVADPRRDPSLASSFNKSSTPGTSVTSDRRVTFAPARYRDHSGSGKWTPALENHYQNVEELREAASARNLRRAQTMRSHRSVGTLHSPQNSVRNPYSSQRQSLRGTLPPFVRQESSSSRRKPTAHGRESEGC